MNCKNLICFLILTLVVLSCAFSGCLGSDSSDSSSNVSAASNESATTNTSAANTSTAANTSNATNTSTTANTSNTTNTSTSSSSVSSKNTGLVSISEAELKSAAAVTKNYLVYFGNIPNLRNMDMEYNQSSNTITIAIIVSDSTDGAIAQALADLTLIILNEEAQYFNKSIKSADPSNYSTNSYGRYHGGLYDECNVIIAVAPISHAGNSDYYYVSQRIPAGSHNPIYRLR